MYLVISKRKIQGSAFLTGLVILVLKKSKVKYLNNYNKNCHTIKNREKEEIWNNREFLAITITTNFHYYYNKLSSRLRNSKQILDNEQISAKLKKKEFSTELKSAIKVMFQWLVEWRCITNPEMVLTRTLRRGRMFSLSVASRFLCRLAITHDILP